MSRYGCFIKSSLWFVFWNASCLKERSTCYSFRDVMTSKTLASIQRYKSSVESFGLAVLLKLREARRKEAFHAITDFTLLHVLSRNRCNFFSLLAVKFVG